MFKEHWSVNIGPQLSSQPPKLHDQPLVRAVNIYKQSTVITVLRDTEQSNTILLSKGRLPRVRSLSLNTWFWWSSSKILSNATGKTCYLAFTKIQTANIRLSRKHVDILKK